MELNKERFEVLGVPLTFREQNYTFHRIPARLFANIFQKTIKKVHFSIIRSVFARWTLQNRHYNICKGCFLRFLYIK